ncbi:MAG: hypothetical protein FWB91_00365 [Defluviitaleaceae bacterium]|nr:hypothetical protein [Defluviitaleaceae bacterium]
MHIQQKVKYETPEADYEMALSITLRSASEAADIRNRKIIGSVIQTLRDRGFNENEIPGIMERLLFRYAVEQQLGCEIF